MIAIADRTVSFSGSAEVRTLRVDDADAILVEGISRDATAVLAPSPSLADVLLWVCENRGADAEDVAEHFGIPDSQAVELVGALIDKGLVGYDS